MGPELISVIRLRIPGSFCSRQLILTPSADWDGVESAQKGMVI